MDIEVEREGERCRGMVVSRYEMGCQKQCKEKNTESVEGGTGKYNREALHKENGRPRQDEMSRDTRERLEWNESRYTRWPTRKHLAQARQEGNETRENKRVSENRSESMARIIFLVGWIRRRGKKMCLLNVYAQQ